MPTYEYECLKCGHRFELFQSMSEEPRKRCPKCRGKVRRLLGAGAGIIFKGSGFYETDYKKSKRPAEKKDSGGESAAEKSKTEKSKAEDTKAKGD